VITVTSTATDGHTGVIAIFQNGVGSRTYAIANVEGTSTWVTAAASTQSGGVTHMRQDYSTNVITNNGTVSFTVTQSGGVVIGFGATFITIASSGINLAASLPVISTMYERSFRCPRNVPSVGSISMDCSSPSPYIQY